MANHSTAVHAPTQAEFRDVDRQLYTNGSPSLTTRGLEEHDRRWATRHAQPDDYTPQGYDTVETLTREQVCQTAYASQLTTAQCTVIVCKLQGYTLQEIADANGYTTSTAKRNLDSAVASLRAQLSGSRWFGLLDLLRVLDTLESNWPRMDR
jgi:DNA-directed RNA polymerase specialized sigma24 family protein